MAPSPALCCLCRQSPSPGGEAARFPVPLPVSNVATRRSARVLASPRKEGTRSLIDESHIDAGGGGARLLLLFFIFIFMDDVKPGVPGEGRKAGGGGDGAPRRPLVPSEKGNAAASPASFCRRREQAASRFKPAAAAATRRSTSPSPARAASAALDGAPSCNNRARSADRARPTSPAPSPPQLKLKPSSSSPTASRPASPARDAAAPEPRGTSAKQQTANGLRSESTPVKKIDRLVRGLPSSEAAKASKLQAPERKRSPARRNGAGNQNQCENARPPESSSPAKKRVGVEQHRWPAMATGRQGSAAPAPATTSNAGNAGRRSSSASSAGRSPMARTTTRPSEGKCLRSPSSEMAKRAAMRRSRREGHDSDEASSQTTSEGSRSASRSTSVPILHRSSSSSSPSKSKVVSAAATSPTSKATCQSPSRIRPSASCRSKCASSSAAQPVFNYIVDARKGKKAANQVENVHQLRLLDNRYLQWRFVNAISESTLSFRRNNAESIIFGVSEKILALQDALTTARIDVRLRQQEMKLYHIVTEQITYLEQWPELEEENSSTLAEAVEALKASTLRLPVTSGAHAEAIAVKNAVSSAVDVMQALSSSICYLQSKVEDRTSLVSQLSVMARQEKSALDECRELLVTAAKLQVQESSLRTNLMQLREDS
ncbi:hypothetical protein QOZ80_8BG0661310 [Eleusine coracana subsp. coracana]|nr:hypothetical protein QOZ80_8BG0661310 [Eleusine coracana subsp. coracana]